VAHDDGGPVAGGREVGRRGEAEQVGAVRRGERGHDVGPLAVAVVRGAQRACCGGGVVVGVVVGGGRREQAAVAGEGEQKVDRLGAVAAGGEDGAKPPDGVAERRSSGRGRPRCRWRRLLFVVGPLRRRPRSCSGPLGLIPLGAPPPPPPPLVDQRLRVPLELQQRREQRRRRRGRVGRGAREPRAAGRRRRRGRGCRGPPDGELNRRAAVG